MEEKQKKRNLRDRSGSRPLSSRLTLLSTASSDVPDIGASSPFAAPWLSSCASSLFKPPSAGASPPIGCAADRALAFNANVDCCGSDFFAPFGRPKNLLHGDDQCWFPSTGDGNREGRLR